MGLGQLEFDIHVILASGKSHYTKDAAVNKEKSSVECTPNDDSVSTPRKTLPRLQTSFFQLFSLKKLRRRASFVAKTQRVCDL